MIQKCEMRVVLRYLFKKENLKNILKVDIVELNM